MATASIASVRALAAHVRDTMQSVLSSPRPPTVPAKLDAELFRWPHDRARAVFAGLDDLTWARLLYTSDHGFANVRAFLPAMPSEDLQRSWVGYAGAAHLELTAPFCQLVRSLMPRRPGRRFTLLDYGIGFGRHARWFLRDLPRGRLCGVDPHGPILKTCRELRVDAFVDLAQIDYWPGSNPFGRPFDLAYAYSVLTHLPEDQHLHVVEWLARAVRRGALVVATVFERGLWSQEPEMLARFDETGYAFKAFPPHPDFPARQVWGNTAIAESYIARRWTRWFAVERRTQLPDSQIAVVLRRK